MCLLEVLWIIEAICSPVSYDAYMESESLANGRGFRGFLYMFGAKPCRPEVGVSCAVCMGGEAQAGNARVSEREDRT